MKDLSVKSTESSTIERNRNCSNGHLVRIEGVGRKSGKSDVVKRKIVYTKDGEFQENKKKLKLEILQLKKR